MCGILVSVQDTSENREDLEACLDELRKANGQRGPDAQNSITIELSNPNGSFSSACFYASELQLRGNGMIVQPHTSITSGDVLCWNGEVFGGLNVSLDENDGVKLFERLQAMVSCEEEFPEIMDSLEGPYAVVYFHESTSRLYIGRDRVGKRSLLLHRPTAMKPYMLLASVSLGSHPIYDFEELSTDSFFYMDLKEGFLGNSSIPSTDNAIKAINRRSSYKINCGIHSQHFKSASEEEIARCANEFCKYLEESVCQRIRSIPALSGSMARLAVLFSGGIDSAIIAFLADRFVPADEPIDLLNVAFENPRKLQNASRQATEPTTAFLSSIYSVPDRVTGLDELEELRHLCPNRQWNFIEVDVPFTETSSARPTIEKLMHPQNTVMDMSLGLALYFASRGRGWVTSSDGTDRKTHTSSARVLLSGLGSDELLGGYARHRSAFESGSWLALNDELQLEIDRISTRNLGRDDRIVSSHGKELRLPFLSLPVVKFVASLPVQLKVDPHRPPGVGDKILLRVAARQLGMVLASGRKKRAMQFGSQSARMEVDGSHERRGDLVHNPS